MTSPLTPMPHPGAPRRVTPGQVWRRLRPLLLPVALAACIWAVARQWDDVRHELDSIGWWPVVIATVCGIGNNVLNAFGWRAALEGMGSPVPHRSSLVSFFASQLGKYLPGSVWPVVAQISLNERHGVPASRSVAAFVVVLMTSLATALTIGALTLPFVSADAARQYWWVLALVPFFVASVHPAVLRRLVRLVSRVTRRRGDVQIPDGRTLIRTSLWLTGGWLLLGVHLAVLVHRVDDGSGSVWLISTGAFALAWSAGLLVLIAPAGLGVREAVLAAALLPVLPVAATTAIALLSRVVLTVADLICGLTALAVSPAVRRAGRGQRTGEGGVASD